MVRGFNAVFIFAVACLLANAAPAHTYKFHTLYSFCTESNCADGGGLYANLMMDQAGNLYGGTTFGGASDGGTIFELTKKGKNWKQQTLYSFCSEANCGDGNYPTSPLIVDSDGNLYGTTRNGGIVEDAGVVFKLTPNAKRTKWKHETLYKFCSKMTTFAESRGVVHYCQDGKGLYGGLTYAGAASGAPYDGVSPLYGATAFGGRKKSNDGVLFQLRRNGKKWKPISLYDFCSKARCKDGGGPSATLLADATGNLFGTLYVGGGNATGEGALFQWDQNAESLLYSFCPDGTCSDGSAPQTSLIFDASHNLFGAANEGGAHNAGALFYYDGAEHKLYDFCSQTNCADGDTPEAGLVLGTSGNLFGTTSKGGAHGKGVVFKYNDGEIVLYDFCSLSNCADGDEPASGLIIDSAGNLYGTTVRGGGAGSGTVFELEFWVLDFQS